VTRMSNVSRWPARACAFVVVALVTGCAGGPTRPPMTVEAAPRLELLESAPLAIPAGCEPAPGVVYRTRFTVDAEGRVGAATPESGAGCVQAALARWVESFRYRPSGAVAVTTIDWMAVSARRGT
jgi:hypothetical protein